MKLISPDTQRLLELSFLPGVGSGALRTVIPRIRQGGPSELENAISIASKRLGSGSGKQNPDGWRDLLEKCASEQISILSALDDEYPAPLRSIEDFPPFLYVRGNVSALQQIGAAVVGTREASHLGLSWAKQISQILSERGFSIVSGLALGIDTAAHEGALLANGVTVAVLAHGVDKVTPASNRALADAILDAGGALISEHPPGVPPRRAEYVRRNRIQSGMSVCSIVVESGDVGGAIHQGHFTAKQGRSLFCVQPEEGTQGSEQFRYEGGMRLSSEVGAKPIRNRADLLSILESGQLQARYEALMSDATKGSLL